MFYHPWPDFEKNTLQRALQGLFLLVSFYLLSLGRFGSFSVYVAYKRNNFSCIWS